MNNKFGLLLVSFFIPGCLGEGSAVGAGVEAFEEGEGFGGVGGDGGEVVENGDEVGGRSADCEDGKPTSGARHGDIVYTRFVAAAWKIALCDIVDYNIVKFKTFSFMDGYNRDAVAVKKIAFIEGTQLGKAGF